MSVTLSLSPGLQVVLPKELCRRQKLKPGATLHVTEIGGGIFVRAGSPPTERELRAIFRAVDAGEAPRPMTAADEQLIADEIKAHRAARSRRKS